jgi:hypothetical protein
MKATLTKMIKKQAEDEKLAGYFGSRRLFRRGAVVLLNLIK